MDLALNNLQRLIWHKTQTTNQQLINGYNILQKYFLNSIVRAATFSAQPREGMTFKAYYFNF